MLRLFLSSFGVSLIGAGCAFLSHLLLARLLPAAEYGVYSFIFSLALMLGVFSLFGFQNSVVRLIPQYLLDEQEAVKVKSLMGFSLFFVGCLAGLASLIVFGGLSFSSYVEVYGRDALLLGMALVALMAVMRLLSSFMRGFGRVRLSVVFEGALREFLFLGILLFCFIFGGGLTSAFDALFLLAASLGVVIVIAAVLVHLMEPKVHGQVLYTGRGEYKHWLHLSFPMMLTIFAQRMMRRSDIVVLGFMVQPALVGAYAIAASFADVAGIGQKGVFATFSARAASLYKQQDLKALKALYNQVRLYGVLAAAGMIMLIAVAFPFVIGWFGEAYEAGYSALLILLVGQFINIAFGPVGMLMIMTEHEKIAMRYTLIFAGVNIVLNPLAIVFYGLSGAAFVTAACLTLRGALCYAFVKKRGLI